MSYCIYILVGPGDATIRRTSDMLESFWHFAPANQIVDCYLVADNCLSLDSVQTWLDKFQTLHVIPNPLSNSSASINDRVTAGTLTAIGAISSASTEYDFVLKLDDDALVIGDFFYRLKTLFSSNSQIGKVGTLHHFPDGAERPGLKSWAPKVEAATSLSSAFREFRRTIRGQRSNSTLMAGFKRFKVRSMARTHGYTPGLHVQGGSYALSFDCVRSIKNQWPDAFLFNHTGLGEDVTLSLLCMSVGFELLNYNQTDEVFGIWWRTPTLSPTELVNRNYAIIHSLKYEDANKEVDVRKFFKDTRLKSPDSIA
ncbi:MAG: hypothetical protein AAF438_01970 [Pseudomonadota bacterium]